MDVLEFSRIAHRLLGSDGRRELRRRELLLPSVAWSALRGLRELGRLLSSPDITAMAAFAIDCCFATAAAVITRTADKEESQQAGDEDENAEGGVTIGRVETTEGETGRGGFCFHFFRGADRGDVDRLLLSIPRTCVTGTEYQANLMV